MVEDAEGERKKENLEEREILLSMKYTFYFLKRDKDIFRKDSLVFLVEGWEFPRCVSRNNNKAERPISHWANIVLGTVIYVLGYWLPASYMIWDQGPGDAICPAQFLTANSWQSPALESEATVQSVWKHQEILNNAGNFVLKLVYK